MFCKMSSNIISSFYFQILLIETLHSVALMVTVFIVIPSLDPISGLLFTLNIAIVPGFLKIWFPRNVPSDNANEKERKPFLSKTFVAVLSFLAAIGQIGAIGK